MGVMGGSVVSALPVLPLLHLLAGGVLGGPDDGPGDPDFRPNDGDLDSPLRPLDTPQGNFHIIQEEEVYVLNRDTFAHFVKPRDLVLVEFYAPWCGHCKSLEPEYAKAAKELHKEGKVFLAKVDSTKEVELAKEYFVQGFPTIILFRNGDKVEEYPGGRTAGDIIDYMRQQADPNWKPPPTAVLTLTMDNFTKVAKTKELMLTMFYAPWCKHCKQLEPEFEGAAQELEGWGITLSKVDGTREKELADQHNVGGWPHLLMFRKGRPFEYNGPREKANIVRFMKEQNQPPSVEISTATALANKLDRLEATVLGLFNGQSDLYEEYLIAANDMRGTHRFLHTFNPDLGKQYGLPLDTVAVIMPDIFWTKYENRTYAFSKKSGTYKEIIQFVRKRSIPLVGWRTKRNAGYKYADRPLIVVYYDVNYDHQYVKETQFVRDKVVEIAKHFIDSNLKFAISNEEEFVDEVKALGLEDSGADVNVACYTEKQKFRMVPTDDFEAETLGEYVEGLRTGKVRPYMKSLPVPKEQEGPVLKIVANNYDELIHKVKKDAVMFFHAPWCGHCKEFDPVYKKVAKKMMKTNQNIVFGKFDATANDMPYMFPTIRGFPSVYFISAYEKFDPILYQGDRTYKALKDWINRHSSIFLTEEEKSGIEAHDDELPELPEEIQSYQDENLEEKFSAKKEDVKKEDEEKKDTGEKEESSKDEL